MSNMSNMSSEPCRFLTPGKFFRTGMRLRHPVLGTATVVKTGITVVVDDGWDGYELDGCRAKLDIPRKYRKNDCSWGSLAEVTVDAESVDDGIWEVLK